MPLRRFDPLGDAAMVEGSGNGCNDRCAICNMAGDCVLPREGVFARVIRGGTVRPGEMLVLL